MNPLPLTGEGRVRGVETPIVACSTLHSHPAQSIYTQSVPHPLTMPHPSIQSLLTLKTLRRIVLALLLLSLAFSAIAQTSPPTPAAVPAYRQANNVAILTVRGEIDSVTLMSLERRMKQAVADGADAVVLDIDTFGGELAATLEICNLLKDRNDTPANVVAWVHPKAYSAGAIMSLACREIVVAPASTIGDAAPIDMLGRQMAPTERAKLLSPLLAELIDSARRNHYDEKLVQAFIMLEQRLWMIENTKTQQRIFVDAAEYRTAFGEEPPTQLGTAPAAVLPALPGITSPLLPFINQSIPRKADHAALTQKELQRQVEFEQMLPPARSPLADSDRGQWKLLMQVTDGTTLLTLKPDEAVYYGIAAAVIANDAELTTYFGAQSIRRYDQTWSESLVRFLISWPVRAVLIIIFLICLFIELAIPGFGVFGATSIVALLILIGAPALAGMAQWWEILVIIIGLVLVATELFLIPGFGIVGVAGAGCLLVGVVGTFVSGDINSAAGQNQMWTGLAVTLLSAFVASIVIWFLARQMHTLPFINRLILHTELKDAPAGTASGLLAAMGADQRALAVGDTGIAHTDLRPSGRANFSGRLVDVTSVSTYIEKGSPLRVVSVGRFAIEVEESSP